MILSTSSGTSRPKRSSPGPGEDGQRLPKELHTAHFAAGGATNAEIASQMFSKQMFSNANTVGPGTRDLPSTSICRRLLHGPA